MSKGDRLAAGAFVVVVLAGAVVLRAFGEPRFFYYDEWVFLTQRDVSVDGLFVPHWSHWSTMPVLIYRALWHVVGLRSYLPYQGLAIVLHLIVATMLRVVMRRAGAGPWVATGLASLFVFFGTGFENILWAFQIGFTGALAFGLAHLLLADHEGGLDRRDWFGLLAGGMALTFSGVGLVMAVVVGLAALMRRGWRVALVHTGPLGALYLLWFLTYGDEAAPDRSGLGNTIEFAWTGVVGAFEGLARNPLLAWTVAGVLLAGLVCAWHTASDWNRFRAHAAVPLALMIGAVLFIALTGSARAEAYGADRARASRYAYVVAGLTLPVLAVAVGALLRRWRFLLPGMLALLAVGLAGNIGEFVDQHERDEAFHPTYREILLTAPHLPLAREVPSTHRPEPTLAKGVTVGWLLAGARSGRVPQPAVAPAIELAATLHLALEQRGDFGRAFRTCSPLRTPLDIEVDDGDAFFIQGGAARARVRDVQGAPRSEAKVLNVAHGGKVMVYGGPLLLRISPSPAVQFCGIERAEARSTA